MSSLLKISEAASLALHTVLLLAARKGELLSNSQIATALDVSENHLSKVLQRLAKQGIVKSVRGPKGGFTLEKDTDSITMLDVYEAIEGPIIVNECLLNKPVCGGGKNCLLGGMFNTVNSQVREKLSRIKLSDIKNKHLPGG